MRQKAPGAIKGGAVPVESGGKEHHDVCFLPPLVPDFIVGDLLEDEGRHSFPHLEGSADGIVRVVEPQLLCVVLDAGNTEGWALLEAGTMQGKPSPQLQHHVPFSPKEPFSSKDAHQQKVTERQVWRRGKDWQMNSTEAYGKDEWRVDCPAHRSNWPLFHIVIAEALVLQKTQAGRGGEGVLSAHLGRSPFC